MFYQKHIFMLHHKEEYLIFFLRETMFIMLLIYHKILLDHIIMQNATVCLMLMNMINAKDDYSEERKKFPEIGSHYVIDNKDYMVSSMNIISTVIKLDGGEDETIYLPLEEFNKQARANRKREHYNKPNEEN